MANPLVSRSGRAMTPGVALHAAIQQIRQCKPNAGGIPDPGTLGDVLRVTASGVASWATEQTLRLAKVISGPGVGAQQLYVVELLSAVDKSLTGIQVSNCFVPDDDADAFVAGDLVTVAVPSDGADSSTYHAFIVAAANVAEQTLQWAFATPEE